MPENEAVKKHVGLIVLTAVLCSCGPKLSNVKAIVDTFAKKRVAVVDFKDAPGQANSGEGAADMMAQKLREAGFFIVNRQDIEKVFDEQKIEISGAVSPGEAQKIGRLSGVDYLLTGVVTEESMRPVIIPAIYTTEYVTFTDVNGQTFQRPIQIMARPAETVMAATYSLSVRITSIETGQIVWSGSASDSVNNASLQDVGKKVVDSIGSQLFKFIVKEHKLKK